MPETLSPEEVSPQGALLIEALEVIEDPRIERKKLYPLVNILVISLVAVAAGANSWCQIEDFCNYHKEWFSKYLDMTNGTPSHDTFRRVFCVLNPDVVQTVLQEWIRLKAKEGNPGRHISFDGKTLRGSRWGDEDAVHILNAYDTGQQLKLGQVAVGAKENEITAMPKIIKNLELEGSICTGDALLTQKSIAEEILKKKGDYCLAVKKNQSGLYNEIITYFSSCYPGVEYKEKTEKNRGWIETRKIWVASSKKIEKGKEWQGAQKIIKIKSEKVKGELHKCETRYYISSLSSRPEDIMKVIRDHWGIENGLHRTLDVIFREDECQTRERNAAINLSVLRKLAGSILRQIPGRSLKQRMMGMAMSSEFRDRFIKCEF